jgi:hypothetical protein
MQEQDEHKGRGGQYEMRDGKRVLIRRAGMNLPGKKDDGSTEVPKKVTVSKS